MRAHRETMLRQPLQGEEAETSGPRPSHWQVGVRALGFNRLPKPFRDQCRIPGTPSLLLGWD